MAVRGCGFADLSAKIQGKDESTEKALRFV
jgi:hypothetical protein